MRHVGFARGRVCERMGETSVEVSFCDAGNLDGGSIDESVDFIGLYYVHRSVSKTR